MMFAPFFIRRLGLLICCTGILSCGRDPHITRAVYHWKSNTAALRHGTAADGFLHRHNIGRVYVKVLDVAWHDEKGPLPVSKTDIDGVKQAGYEVVPVAFITNEVFQKIETAGIEALAKNVSRFMLRLSAGAKHSGELQVDCDWTESTREKYFIFLEMIKKIHPGHTLSVTIRLYQFRHADKAGIPPVDRGMLMIYNMLDASRFSEKNSIFDPLTAAAYFNGQDYRLPLDIALPAFNWGLIYRDGRLLKIEQELTTARCDSLGFLTLKKPGIYEVNTDTVWSGLFIRPGYLVKVESAAYRELLLAAQLGAGAVNSDSVTVAIFDLDNDTFKPITHEQIEEVYNSFN